MSKQQSNKGTVQIMNMQNPIIQILFANLETLPILSAEINQTYPH